MVLVAVGSVRWTVGASVVGEVVFVGVVVGSDIMSAVVAVGSAH